MSSSKSLVINCGASHVCAAHFRANNGQLSLDALDTRDLQYDIANDDAWLPAVAAALRDLIRSNSKFRGRATFILPGYLVLTKPIKVPHVEKAKQQQIIAFEAQNNIPFPLAETVWGSQVIADDGVETEVLLFAQKAEQANRFCGLMASMGLLPVALQPSSLLDFNTYRLLHGGQEEDTLIVNIGARSTNLTFISAAGLFIRNINLGGNAFTQMVADGISKPFAQAEQVKVGFYSGQSNIDADDPQLAPIQQKAQDFMKRMSQQITQSIIAYRRTSNRAAPQRILLTGRGALLSGLPEYLSEAQKVSVDYFNPSSALTLSGGLNQETLERLSFQISEVVGEASRLVRNDAFGVNILPPVIRARLAFERKKPILLACAACLALAPLPMGYKYWAQANQAKQEMKQVQARNIALQAMHAQIEAQANTAQDLHDRISKFEGLMNSKSNWIVFFSELQQLLFDVKDVWLDNLSVDRSQPAPTPGMPQPQPGGQAAVPAGPPTYTLNVKGRMLLRNFDPTNPDAVHSNSDVAIKSIQSLAGSFAKMPFVKSSESDILQTFKLDQHDPRLLGFEFSVNIDPEKPL
jgi:type IV pilus assembly protein PilM